MFRRYISAVLIGSGVLLIVAALVLGVYNLWDDRRAQKAVDSIIQELKLLRGDADTSDESGDDPNENENASPSFDPGLDPNRDMPAVEIDGHWYIGTLAIPSLALDLPIIDTWDYEQMKLAPCRYSGSVYLKNMVICGHNYTAHFARLVNLNIGDSVVFTDMDGNEFSYKVSQIETIPGTAVEDMKTGDWDLTLFTCNFSGQARVTVRCDEVKK